MGILDRSYDYTKEHYKLDCSSEKGIYCTHCNKVLDAERKSIDSMGMMFTGGFYAHQKLPCKPYEKLNASEVKGGDES